MANAPKKGLDYFFLSVDFLDDIKVRKIMKACGGQSVSVLIALLSRIYRFDGYFMTWDADVRFLVADSVGTKELLVQEIVNKAVDVGFFDAKIYKDRKILTSNGIQKRYFNAVSRRKEVSYDATLILNSQNVSKNAIDVNINPINVDINQHREEKRGEERRREEKPAFSQKNAYGEFGNVMLSDEQYQALKKRYRNADAMIQMIDSYCQSHGKTYKNYYAAVIQWEQKEEAFTGKGKAAVSDILSGSFSTSEASEEYNRRMLEKSKTMSLRGNRKGLESGHETHNNGDEKDF